MEAQTAAAMIERLELEPHPEGGWYRETWRSVAAPGERAGASAILFLLDAGERSHWHRVDADELWLWHAGCPVTLSIAASERGPSRQLVLGPDVLSGEAPQALVPAGHWQSAGPGDGWTLVSCVVSPGFEFSGFKLAPEGWEPATG